MTQADKPRTAVPLPAPPAAGAAAPLPAVHTPPRQQLGDLPIEELRTIGAEFGLNLSDEKDKAAAIAAIHRRRQLISSLDRVSLVDVLHWIGKAPAAGAANEQLAVEIVQNHSMRFSGLSDRGLLALALLRGCDLENVKGRDEVIKRLKSQENLFAKLKRKTRGWVGKRLQRMVVGDEAPAPLPPPAAAPRPGDRAGEGPRQQALREEIEEAGFFSGIANRVKRQADSYVNQKLDEIEARIDRKLDEIDRRLAEWRDKEIANRIRILKITLWVSVVVAVISLIYSYVQVEAKQWRTPTVPTHQSTPATPPKAPAASTSGTGMTTAIRTNRSSAI